MTENEAKEYMEDEIRCVQRAAYCDRDCAKCKLVKEEKPLLEAFGEAIQALSEIQQYRAIGAPTQIYEKIGGLNIELGKYHSIGTVDEFKALKEKEERFDRNIKMFNEIGLEIRAKAIDEFVNKLKEEIFNGYATLEDYSENYIECVAVEDILEIAEQMKAGV